MKNMENGKTVKESDGLVEENKNENRNLSSYLLMPEYLLFELNIYFISSNILLKKYKK